MWVHALLPYLGTRHYCSPIMHAHIRTSLFVQGRHHLFMPSCNDSCSLPPPSLCPYRLSRSWLTPFFFFYLWGIGHIVLPNVHPYLHPKRPEKLNETSHKVSAINFINFGDNLTIVYSCEYYYFGCGSLSVRLSSKRHNKRFSVISFIT